MTGRAVRRVLSAAAEEVVIDGIETNPDRVRHFLTKVEMVVTQGDEEGKKIAAMVRQIGASKFVLGLHDHSFLYKLAMAQGNNTANNFMNCRVLAIKQPSSSPLRINKASAPSDQKVFST